MKKSELLTMVVSELKALAKKMKIKLPARAKKRDIVDAIMEAGAAEPAKNSKTRKKVAKKTIVKKPAPSKRAPAGKPAEAPSGGREWKMPPGVEEPIMAQERVSESKYYTGPAPQRPAGPDLPEGYGEEKITLMSRDPYLAYVYWEVTQGRLEREKAWFGWNSKLCIRIYDVTGVRFDGRNAIGYFDQEIFERISSWYFDLGRPRHSFVADIGLRSEEGKFLTLARSNYVTMPRDGVSEAVDEEWMLVDEEFWKLYGFPGGLSSPHVQEMWKRRRMQEISSPGLYGRGKARSR